MEQSDYFKYPVHSVKYIFSIIELLATGKMEYSLSEIIKETNLSKGVVYRLLGTLKSLGYLAHNPETRKYYLSYKFAKIGISLNERIRILEIIPHMKKLAQEYKEMVNLAVLEQSRVVYLHNIECPHALRLDFKVGTYQPAHCTALGRVLLAYQDDRTISSILKKNRLKSYTAKTVTDPAQFIQILQKIRKEGYSFVSEEYRPGVCCVAAPIFDEHGSIVASLSLSLPTARMSPDILERMVKSLKNYTDKIKLPQMFRT
ncbi:MAG: IclR family transcriptional regulator [Atribacterota bacterium]|nr:IclR family transcriptional regulator [Atribacterota bacterium]MDD5637874.1 IclR family transcriptional regulator [Atribacterota bacterium]